MNEDKKIMNTRGYILTLLVFGLLLIGLGLLIHDTAEADLWEGSQVKVLNPNPGYYQAFGNFWNYVDMDRGINYSCEIYYECPALVGEWLQVNFYDEYEIFWSDNITLDGSAYLFLSSSDTVNPMTTYDYESYWMVECYLINNSAIGDFVMAGYHTEVEETGGGSAVNVTVSEVNPADGNNSGFNIIFNPKIQPMGLPPADMACCNLSCLINTTFDWVNWSIYVSDDNITYSYLTGDNRNNYFYRMYAEYWYLPANITKYWRLLVLDDVTSAEAFNQTFVFTVTNDTTANYTSAMDDNLLQLGFDAANIFFFIWILLAASIVFGRNAYMWFISSLFILLLGLTGGLVLIPVGVYAYFALATVCVAIIGFVRFLVWILEDRDKGVFS